MGAINCYLNSVELPIFKYSHFCRKFIVKYNKFLIIIVSLNKTEYTIDPKRNYFVCYHIIAAIFYFFPVKN